MSESKQGYGKFRILLYLIAVALVISAIGEAAYYFEGSSALTLVQITISAVLSAALVHLYFRQTAILNAQRTLLTQELNQEARQEHTETLRDRVQTWHGNPDIADPVNSFDNSTLNLPETSGVSFIFAPTGSYSTDPPEEKEFRVIPHQLENDRYLDDLLENHADDLLRTRQKIEQLQHDLVTFRKQFMEIFNAGIVREKENYDLKPARRFSRWIFDLLVMLERGRLKDFDDLRARANRDLERGETAENPQGPDIWYRVSFGRTSSPIYSATWPEKDQKELSEHLDQVAEDVEITVEQVLDLVENQQPYEETVRAARVLEEGEAAIEHLEELLVEYDGRIVYPGDCKYLDEAKVGEL